MGGGGLLSGWLCQGPPVSCETQSPGSLRHKVAGNFHKRLTWGNVLVEERALDGTMTFAFEGQKDQCQGGGGWNWLQEIVTSCRKDDEKQRAGNQELRAKGESWGQIFS